MVDDATWRQKDFCVLNLDIWRVLLMEATQAQDPRFYDKHVTHRFQRGKRDYDQNRTE